VRGAFEVVDPETGGKSICDVVPWRFDGQMVKEH
jgi:hypothetical protein